MEARHKQSITHSDHQPTARKSLFIGGVIVLIIAVAPFVFYSYKSFPKSQIWETSLFSISTDFPNWFNYAWYLVGKIVPLYLLLLWFFTCRHWWHWIILVPIAMYSFQLWGLIRESNNQYDVLEIYYLIPLMMFLVPAVYLVRAKLFAKVRGDDLSSFEEELGARRSTWQQLKDLFR
jgi:uncharacterized membrane protein